MDTNKKKKKMPVIIEISDLDSVAGGATPITAVKTTTTIAAHRCPVATGVTATRTIVLTTIRTGLFG
jgi:hypothetical protein